MRGHSWRNPTDGAHQHAPRTCETDGHAEGRPSGPRRRIGAGAVAAARAPHERAPAGRPRLDHRGRARPVRRRRNAPDDVDIGTDSLRGTRRPDRLGERRSVRHGLVVPPHSWDRGAPARAGRDDLRPGLVPAHPPRPPGSGRRARAPDDLDAGAAATQVVGARPRRASRRGSRRGEPGGPGPARWAGRLACAAWMAARRAPAVAAAGRSVMRGAPPRCGRARSGRPRRGRTRCPALPRSHPRTVRRPPRARTRRRRC